VWEEEPIAMMHWTEITVDGNLQLRLVASEAGIRTIDFPPARPVECERDDRDPLLVELTRELAAYFAGRLRRFEVPLDMQGTAFQKRVWRELEGIPFGETRSYRQVAMAIGAENAVRAVGAANGANPVPIVVPCHRVIGSSGKLVGYGGGLELKKRLLELEGSRAMGMRYEE
jgi:methylated-DNA-[protein]-cysteine S-methyltransferase